MRCERAIGALIDQQAGALSAENAAQLEAHLSACSACRDEAAAVGRLWAGLGDLRARPDTSATDRIARALRAAAAAQMGRPGLPWIRAAAYAAILLLGAVIGRLSALPGAEPTAAGDGYLLLLRGPENSLDSGADVVAEYAGWARRLSAEGRLVAAEKLADDALWLPARSEAQAIGGFFLVNATDMDEAAAIARGGPHLNRGGTIEVRRIDSGGQR
jgi:hypothetical protein